MAAMSYDNDYDNDAWDDDRDDDAADARWEEAAELLADYHADSDCPAENAGDDDCECGYAMGSDYRFDRVGR